MTLYAFDHSNEIEQVEMLWQGVRIGERSDKEHKIALYQIDGFYVEVFCHPEHDAISRIRSFRSVCQFSPYLDEIDLAKLLG